MNKGELTGPEWENGAEGTNEDTQKGETFRAQREAIHLDKNLHEESEHSRRLLPTQKTYDRKTLKPEV